MLKSKKLRGIILGMILSTVAAISPIAVFANVEVASASGFADADTAENNPITAGSLDIEISSSIASFDPALFLQGDSATRDITIANNGTVEMNYNIQYNKDGGDDELCNELKVEFYESGTANLIHSSVLKDLDYTANLGGGADVNWDTVIILPNGVPESAALKDCQFGLDFLAWQAVNTDPDKGWVDNDYFGDFNIESGDWIAPNIPENYGFNATTAFPDTGRPDSLELPCDSYTNENNYAFNWSDESATGAETYDVQITSPSPGSTTSLLAEDLTDPYTSPFENFDYEGTWGFQARAWDADGNDSDWSDVCEITFDTIAPTVAITEPTNADTVGGAVDIRATINDDNPFDYTLTIEDSSGNPIAGFPITVEDETTITDSLIYNWNTAAVDNGVYTITVEATDKAGNHDPTDSVDSVSVTVENILLISNEDHSLSTKGSRNDDGSGDLKAVITWDTNQSATSEVRFDTSEHDDTLPGFDVTDYPSLEPGAGDSTADNTSHSVEVTGLNEDTTYYYRVVSRDALGNEEYSPEYEFTFSKSDPKAGVGDIVMNEIMPDPEGSDSGNEWIEIYNKGAASVDISGYYVTDENTGTKREIVPGGTSLASGDYYVFELSVQILRNSGESVSLFNASDTLLDEYTYGTATEDKTIARLPDGDGPWIDPEGTPGSDNELTKDEKLKLRLQAFEECFGLSNKLGKKTEEGVCNPLFLKFVGLLKNEKSKHMKDKMFKKMTEKAQDKGIVKIKFKEKKKKGGKSSKDDKKQEETASEDKHSPINTEEESTSDDNSSNDDGTVVDDNPAEEESEEEETTTEDEDPTDDSTEQDSENEDDPTEEEPTNDDDNTENEEDTDKDDSSTEDSEEAKEEESDDDSEKEEDKGEEEEEEDEDGDSEKAKTEEEDTATALKRYIRKMLG